MSRAFSLAMAAFPAALIIYLSIKLAIIRFVEAKDRKRSMKDAEDDLKNFNINLTD